MHYEKLLLKASIDQLKIAQTKPIFPDFSCFEQTNLPNPTLNNSFILSSTSEDNDTNSDNKLWTDSAVKFAFIYIRKFSNYRKNKEKFFANAALHIGGKTSAQVRGKMQNLIKKYSEEKKEETGKGISKWAYFYLMNEIFGNRKNVRPESLIDSTGNDESSVQRKKKAKLNNNELAYIESIAAISESKMMSAE
ncbi:3982_t:CDS:2, partial [Gigaspora margarita]